MILRLLALASLSILVAAAPAEAAKGARSQGGPRPGRLLARFDPDHNGTIDGQEVARLQAAFTALSALDTDRDGKLSDSEVAAAKVPAGRRNPRKATTPSATPATPAPKTP